MKKKLLCLLTLLILISSCSSPAAEELQIAEDYYAGGEYLQAIDTANEIIAQYPNKTKTIKNAEEIINKCYTAIDLNAAEELLVEQQAAWDNEEWENVLELGNTISSLTSGTEVAEKSRVLTSNATAAIIKRERLVTLMDDIQTAYDSSDWKLVMKLASDIKFNYSGTEEAEKAKTLFDKAKAFKDAAKKAALNKLTSEYDKVKKVTFYYPQSRPYYINTRNHRYIYLVQADSGELLLRYKMAYTSSNWIFFTKIIISIDGNNHVYTYDYYDVIRDNNHVVWEYIDKPMGNGYLMTRSVMEDIANSTETIIRFEGDTYYKDMVVSQAEKNGIKNILEAYDCLLDED